MQVLIQVVFVGDQRLVGQEEDRVQQQRKEDHQVGLHWIYGLLNILEECVMKFIFFVFYKV